MEYNTPSNWLVEHPILVHLRSQGRTGKSWAVLAESFAPLIYSVPAFLGTTLARTDSEARVVLDEVWAEELGIGQHPSHPVLFEQFHRFATGRWGTFPEQHGAGVQAAAGMVDLCASGPWPVGIAAMLAHESQFPVAYGSLLPAAHKDLGDYSRFFELHSAADVEHTSTGRTLLERAVRQKVCPEPEIELAFVKSSALLRTLVDRVWEAL